MSKRVMQTALRNAAVPGGEFKHRPGACPLRSNHTVRQHDAYPTMAPGTGQKVQKEGPSRQGPAAVCPVPPFRPLRSRTSPRRSNGFRRRPAGSVTRPRRGRALRQSHCSGRLPSRTTLAEILRALPCYHGSLISVVFTQPPTSNHAQTPFGWSDGLLCLRHGFAPRAGNGCFAWGHSPRSDCSCWASVPVPTLYCR
jgi:hypothetical protein